jgi:hypothetical protein
METKDIIEELRIKLSHLIPGLEVQGLRFAHLSEGLDNFNNIYVFISHRNRSLIKSPYFYNKKSLIHFTGFSSLNSILRSKLIRLYTLKNPKDPREFSFAGKVLKLPESVIDEAKNGIFQISFCESDIFDSIPEEFNMWRLYGQNGRGVAIWFSIINNPEEWMDFHISRVLYGDEHRGLFKELYGIIKDFKNTEIKVSIDLTKLLPFHKSNLFSLEKEVRIINDRRPKQAGSSSQVWYECNLPNMPRINVDIEKLVNSMGKTPYLEIPIYNPNGNNNFIEKPLLKIEKIFLGYNFSNEESQDLIKGIHDLCEDHLGYIPDIQHTRLRKLYLDSK